VVKDVPAKSVHIPRSRVFCSWLVGRVVRDTIYQHPHAKRAFEAIVEGITGGRTVTRTVAGQKLRIAPSKSIVEFRMALCGTYEPAMTRYLTEVLSPGMKVVDVGAHIGFFTLTAAAQVGPSGRVLAIEPHPRNYASLQGNVELNCYLNVVTLPIAVGADAGDMPLDLPSDTAFTSFAAAAGEGSAIVRVETLDQALSDAAFDRCDLVKIDIEGAELLALRGMEETLERNPAIRLVIEVHPPLIAALGGSALELVDLLGQHGFALSKLDAEGSPHRVVFDDPSRVDIEAAGYLVCSRE
jgi:FkbM family methyltransferase